VARDVFGYFCHIAVVWSSGWKLERESAERNHEYRTPYQVVTFFIFEIEVPFLNIKFTLFYGKNNTLYTYIIFIDIIVLDIFNEMVLRSIVRKII